MTKDEIEGRRYWTPRLLTANTVMSAGAIVLWFFLSNWILDIKTSINKDHDSIDNLTSLIAERHTSGAIWKQATTDRIDFIDGRLVQVEKKIYHE